MFLLVAGVLAWLVPSLGFGQAVSEITGYQASDYYGPPHETRMKTLLEGAKAQMQSDRKTWLLTRPKLQTFSERGEREIIIQAPQCLFDEARHTVSSAGPITMQTADGKYFLDGEGFVFSQTNSSLIISNKVHTTIQQEMMTGPDSKAGASAIEIRSTGFDYSSTTGLATYRDNVRLTGTNLALQSGVLTARLPMKERQLRTITAEQNVVLDYDVLNQPANHIHATGTNAVYTPEDGLVRVTGQPTWRAGQRNGAGRELVIDRTNKVFRVLGQSWLRMPSRNMAASGFLPGATSPARAASPPATNEWVEVRSESYEIHTNSALFRDDVRVTSLAGEQSKGTMNCGRMLLNFEGTNELQRLVAEDKVVIQQEERKLTGGRAVFTGSNGVRDLTGRPTWQVGARRGKGDLIRVFTRENRMLVRENAAMSFPAKELNRFTTLGAPADKAPPPAASSNQTAEIFSDEYLFAPERAIFQGGVYVTHPQMSLACQTLTVALPPEGGQIESILAEQSITFDLMDARGQKVQGKGDKAYYTYAAGPERTNSIVQIFGNPAQVESTNGVTRNPLLILDLLRNKLAAPGTNYSIKGLAPAEGTNKFQLPNSKILE